MHFVAVIESVSLLLLLLLLCSWATGVLSTAQRQLR